MSLGFDSWVYDIPWTGAKVRSHQRVPGIGTWEIIDHHGCDGDGTLQALARGATAPLCPVCGGAVRWQLTHLAPSVAADHKGVGRLP